MKKLKLWDEHASWEAAEKAWDEKAEEWKQSHPVKGLTHFPEIPGIAPDTRKNLKWKAIRYIFEHDKNNVISRYILKKPFLYGTRFLKSLCKRKSYKRDGDFFLYNTPSLEAFEKKLGDPTTVFVLGFSYCEKPLECPSKRFTADCIHDKDHPICRQCLIGKSIHSLPENNIEILIIPTIHYIGEKIFEIQEKHPEKKLLFLITACEMTLEMFGDFGNMAGISGVGVRLDGRICNTMKAFELSEAGIKPGLTVLQKATEKKFLQLLQSFRQKNRK